MDGRSDKSLPTIGFISVVESPEHGLFGGYLVLAPTGRPVEFHCTEPVKPSRAQEILYGPTLESYLYGEQLGQALLSSSKKKPPIILTDIPPMLAVREFVSVPIILIETGRSDGDASSETGESRFIAPADCPSELISQLESLTRSLDLAEPFDRIREAIEEAQRGSQRRAVA